jgi:hypothetical protein
VNGFLPVALFCHFPLRPEGGDLLPSFGKLHVREGQFTVQPLLRCDQSLLFCDQARSLCQHPVTIRCDSGDSSEALLIARSG